MVSVRYIVHDVDAAIAFYTQHLGFAVEMHPAPTFAILTRGDLRLLFSAAHRSWGRGSTHARWPRAGAGGLEPLSAGGE